MGMEMRGRSSSRFQPARGCYAGGTAREAVGQHERCGARGWSRPGSQDGAGRSARGWRCAVGAPPNSSRREGRRRGQAASRISGQERWAVFRGR